MRVSVTDRCMLRCVYCMPAEGVAWKPHDDMLTFEEILRLCRILAQLGIRNIKVTGGEPLLRRGLAPFMQTLKSIEGIEKVTITTNGILLSAFLDEAESLDALPDGVNISLNALDSQRFSRITRMTDSNTAQIFSIIDRLLAMQIPVKINCVPVRSFNEEEILPLALLAQDKNINVRFIELMPLGSAAHLQFVPGAEIISLLESRYGTLNPVNNVPGNGPALYYSIPGFTGKIGFINAISHGFCNTCNRLRLSSEGYLKLCLSSDSGLDLRRLLRSNASDNELAKAISDIVAQKPQFHSLSGIYNNAAANHPIGMSGIGG